MRAQIFEQTLKDIRDEISRVLERVVAIEQETTDLDNSDPARQASAQTAFEEAFRVLFAIQAKAEEALHRD